MFVIFHNTFNSRADEPDGASSKSVSDSVTSLEEGRNDVEDDEEQSPLHAFLEAWGLSQLTPQLSKLFRGDLDSLMLVTEDDLKIAGIPMGPRKKLLRAIELRNETLDSPPVEDLETSL